MNKLVLCKGQLTDDYSFQYELSKKRADNKFSVPASWGVTGRRPETPEFDTDVVSMWDVNFYQMKELVFADPFAPYDANSGTIICFKQAKPKAGKLGELVTTVRDSHAEKKKSRQIAKSDPNYSQTFSEFIEIKKSLIAATVTSVPLLAYTIPISIAQGATIEGLISYSIASFFVIYTLATLVFLTVSGVSSERKKAIKPKTKSPKAIAAENDKNVKQAEGDEVFLVGVYSLIPEIVQISDEIALLVRDKLRLNGPADEVQAWAEIVLKISQLQALVNGGLPSHLIPLMSEDAEAVRAELQETVERMRAEWVELQRSEVAALEYGDSVIEKMAKDDSRAAREGASVFLSGLTGENFVE